jgi:ubiquinone/menaquinone biosynthesis C-methylase UbiE
MTSNAYQRAEMPTGAAAVLDERTLRSSNANLLQILRPGQKVLDVGCGSGAITRDIVDLVGPTGHVRGVDRSTELIGLAKQRYSSIPNLRFEGADILDDRAEERYDVITIARTLQWIADTAPVIRKMISLLDQDGILCVLDYNHTRIEWQPQPPKAMLHFYDVFLRWRADAGMDNAIGDTIRDYLDAQGLTILATLDASEYSDNTMPGFASHLSLWTKVAETRGKQLVADGYITETERTNAIETYNAWCAAEARSMKLYLRATHACI